MMVMARRVKKSKREGGGMIFAIVLMFADYLLKEVSKDQDPLEGCCIREWGPRLVGMCGKVDLEFINVIV